MDTTDKSTDSTPSYSSSWFRSCERETLEPVQGQVKGTLPEWLSGRLTRNGPGRIEYGDTRYEHIFDGSALLHQFTIDNGMVTYRARFLNSDTYQRNKAAHRIVVSEFGTQAYPDPCKTLLQRFMSVFRPLAAENMTDNCLVNVCHLGDQLFALTEAPYMRRLDADTLDTLGPKTYLTDLLAVNTATAHPHVEADGTVYNLGSHFGAAATYNIIKFPAASSNNGERLSSVNQCEVVASIPCQWNLYPSYYHSFALTPNYLVFVEQPLVLNVKKFLAQRFLGRPYRLALEWYGDEKAKFRVVDRVSGKLLSTTYASDAFFTFHHTNAYEKDGQLVVDLCGMDDASLVEKLTMKNVDSEFNFAEPTHRRFVLPLHVDDAPIDTNLVTLAGPPCSAVKQQDGTIDVTGAVLADRVFELPRINYQYNGQEYHYAYGVEVTGRNTGFAQLVKMQVDTGETWVWGEQGKEVSEPVFVAAPHAAHELDGVVLSSLLSQDDPTYVALLVMDPHQWKEVARVEFRACGAVTPTFHGQFAASYDTVHMY